jgi:HEAT repeat protein
LALLAGLAAAGVLAWLLAPQDADIVALERGPAASLPAVPAETTVAPTPARSALRQGHGYYTAPIGSAFTYALAGLCEYSVGHAEAGNQASGFQMQATFAVAVGDRHENTITLQVGLHDVKLTPLAGGAQVAPREIAAALQHPFFVQLGDDGEVRGYRFADNFTAEQRNFVRGVFSAYAHRVAADAPGEWEVEDCDAAGKVVARFVLRAGDDDATVITRQKLRYLEMSGDTLHEHRITGGSRATFSQKLGWIAGAAADERTSMKMVELGLNIEARAKFDFDFTTQSAADPTIDFVALRHAEWLPAAGHREDHAATVAERDRQRWSKRLAGTSLDTLCDLLAELVAAKPQDPEAIDAAFQSLIWMVRLRPEVCALIEQRVRQGVDTALADVLLSGLGAAGSEAAQDLLANLRRDGGLAPALRTSATVALFQTGKPTPRVLNDLTADLHGAKELTGDNAMAMLLLGTLAPRAAGTEIEGRSALDTLLAFESKAQQGERLDLWLNALGNVGTDDVLPHAQRHAGSASELVRGAAYNALRQVQSPRALALLERGLLDPAAGVRADVVSALVEQRTKAAGDALVRAARDDSDAGVRRATIPGLARHAPTHPAARQALEQMAASDPDGENRKAAGAVLKGRQ